MVYQLSEKNQIFVALFAIVVLCAGKLFKDYLYRGGYIEGLTSRLVSSQELVRRGTSDQSGITLILNVTLGTALSNGNSIKVEWPILKGVNMSTTDSDYILTGLPVGVSATRTLNTSTNSSITSYVIFAVSGTVNVGTTLTITMNNITIKGATGADETGNFPGISDFFFTTTSSVESATPVRTPVIVLGSEGVVGTPGPIVEIEKALDIINTRIASETVLATANDLRKIQTALVTVLAYTYGTVKQAGSVFDSQALYDAQKTAIEFIRKEKERAAKNADLLSQDNINKRRMAQINTYYTRNYEANTEVMKNIIFLSIGLIALAVLRKKELIPDSISTLGVIFVLTLGGIVIGQQAYDIIRRNDHDFDKYDWNFNEEEMNKKHITQLSDDPANLSEMGMGMAPCFGPGCCHVGTKWNESEKKCVPSGTASWMSNTLTINVYIMNALEAADKITITLPTGVFTEATSGTRPAFVSIRGNGSGSVVNPFDVTITSGTTISAGSIYTITITGMTGTARNSIIKVKTTKEPSESSIMII
jgi:hypothetical protein